MSNDPKQPADPPTEGASPAGNPKGQGQHGIAEGQHGHQASGLPSDDRHDTETAPSRIEGGDKT